MTVTTPTVRRAARRARPWLVLTAVAVAGAVASLVVVGSGATGGEALDPRNPRPAGTKAVAEVLRDSGVDVDVVTRLDAALDAAGRDPDATALVVHDPLAVLGGDDWARLGDAAPTTVLLEPGTAALAALAPGVEPAGTVDEGTTTPRCDLPALTRVGEVTATGTAWSTDASGADDVTACLPVTGGSGLVEVVDGDRRTTVVGLTDALTNATVASDDDAAYALSLLGRTDHVVWYLPTPGERGASGTDSLASLTPSWVTPSLVLLVVAALAAAVWRGRRLGPLVVERLPVVVRADETREGRARLYERAGARGHALDQLRIGTLGRLGALTGLSTRAPVDDVVARVAPLVRADPRALRHVLVDAVPGDDAELVRLSDSLLDLEQAVREAVRAP